MMPKFTLANLIAAGSLWAITLAVGCTSPAVRSQSPDSNELIAADATSIQLVGDLANAWGLNWQKVESVALITRLRGTGSDPPPNTYRVLLIQEMQTHQVPDANQLLASPDTSLALLTGYLPPGVQKGDRFDVDVRLPPNSETTSLRGGWLMPSRMKDLAVIDNQLRTGHVMAIAQGPVLVEGVVKGDKALDKRGVVMGGGVAQRGRELGLMVSSNQKSIRASTMVASAVNNRFSLYEHGQRQGVATPKNDQFIQLLVHPRYRHNLGRYVRVVRALPLRESPGELAKRLTNLERQLLQPFTSATAALQLEAIGKEAEPVLRKGLQSTDAEVKFHAAEALAYLDVPEAAPVLAACAREEAAFRWHALAALGAMDHLAGYEALTDLLHVPSAETRLGAFRALWQRNAKDPLVLGENMKDELMLHAIATSGEPLVHFTTTRRPEIVLFGDGVKLSLSEPVFAGAALMVKALDAEHVRISKFSANDDDQIVECANDFRSVARGIVELGGGYGDILQMTLEAKKLDGISGRVLIDAVPRANRAYERTSDDEASAASPDSDSLPSQAKAGTDAAATNADPPLESISRKQNPNPLTRMRNWWTSW